MTPPVPGTAFRIETERLTLRCWEPTDAPLWRALLDASDQHLRPWIPYMRTEPRTLEETAERLQSNRDQFVENAAHRYAVFLARDHTLVGEVCTFVHPAGSQREVGYLVDVRHVGHGYAVEATAALVRVVFALLQEPIVFIHCAADNQPSAAVARKLGFRHERTVPNGLEDVNGVKHAMQEWVLTIEEFLGSPCDTAPVRARGPNSEILI